MLRALEFLSEELITKMPVEVGRGHLGNVAACCLPAASLLVLLRLCVDLVWFGVVQWRLWPLPSLLQTLLVVLLGEMVSNSTDS